MRILHTSDLHLRDNSNIHIATVEGLLDKAAELDVDLLTMAGDIFHSPADADILRPKLRDMFANAPCQVLGIPGNHDGSIFSKGYDFGFQIASESPFQRVDTGENVCIYAVPFTEEDSENVLCKLETVDDEHSVKVLLIHCTLDIGFGLSNYGESDDRKYFPVTRASLSALNIDYVLSGHFHTNYQDIDLGHGARFVYPGSPVSQNRKEKGKRHVALVDTVKGVVEKIPLQTFYHDLLAKTVLPGHEDQVLSEISEWMSERSGDHSELEIIVRGMIEIDESDFRKGIERAGQGALVHHEYKDISVVHDHPLYQSFKKTLAERHNTCDSYFVDMRVIGVFSRLIANGEI